jgi:enoyl-CoA hydratase/carnithine racemase
MASPPTFQNVSLSIQDKAIAVFKLNSPKTLNALNGAMITVRLTGNKHEETAMLTGDVRTSSLLSAGPSKQKM